MAFVSIGGPISKPTPSFMPLDATPTPAPAPAAAQQSSIFSNIVAGVKNAAGDVWNALTTPQPAQSINPKVASDAAAGGLFDNLTTAGNQIIDNISSVFADHGNLLKQGVDVGEAGMGALNAAFAPITSVITYAQHIPGVGTIATGLNNVFTAIATGGADAAGDAVDVLPLSPDTKATIRPLAQQLAGLAAQILVGHVGGEVFKAVGDQSKSIVDAVASDPAVKDAAAAPSTAPEGVSKAVAPPEAAPAPALAEPGAPETETTPPAASEPVAPAEPALTEPSAPVTTSAAPEAPAAAPPMEQTPETAPASPPSPRAPVPEPQPLKTEPGVSRIGKSIEVKAVDAGLTQRFDKTAGYDTITIKDQAERATQLVNDSLEQARQIIRGEQPLPDGLKGTSVVTAMEEYLKKNPDGEIAHELANSPLVSATSGAAQELRLAAEREPDSITAKFQEVRAAREAALEKRGGLSKNVKKVVDDIQKEVRKSASKRPAWEDFIKEVQCNY